MLDGREADTCFDLHGGSQLLGRERVISAFESAMPGRKEMKARPDSDSDERIEGSGHDSPVGIVSPAKKGRALMSAGGKRAAELESRGHKRASEEYAIPR